MIAIYELYKPEGEVFCGDGREQELLRFVRAHPRFAAMQNNPAEILSAIDEFGHKRNFLMNVGKSKGAIVVQTIRERPPKTMVELGGYIGYSAIMFADALREAGGQRFISLEKNEDFASVASSLVSIAGLSEFVDIRVGPCALSLWELREEDARFQIDLLFIDHQKSAYVGDLMLCEELSLIRSGSTVVADNVISPGAPLYLDYIRGSRSEKLLLREKTGMRDEYPRRTGNCDLVYESKLYQGFEPTGESDGVEVSVCQ